ncbi:hypothetical protein G9A89_003099 [Geosiphon pyriformis]|nr:hypothetical protein G9A89_003099 [Geosiphon pyriformis]
MPAAMFMPQQPRLNRQEKLLQRDLVKKSVISFIWSVALIRHQIPANGYDAQMASD